MPPRPHIFLLLLSLASVWAEDLPTGAAQIRAPLGESEIVLTTTARCAGAVHSLTWGGKEFIDSHDHGRQLQSALNGDCGGTLLSETYNPTEAGSVSDGAGARSTSRVLQLLAGPHWLQTTTQMAFWLAPDQTSGGQPAKNTTLLSPFLLTKRITLGQPALPQAIGYDVTFHIPLGELHHHLTCESLTGYLPSEFSQFLIYQATTQTLEPLSDGPGEQLQPIVLATPDGRYAMSIYSPEPHAHYGRFRFTPQHVVKWNAVFRLTAAPPATVAAGEYTFRHFVLVGDLALVTAGLRALVK